MSYLRQHFTTLAFLVYYGYTHYVPLAVIGIFLNIIHYSLLTDVVLGIIARNNDHNGMIFLAFL